MISSLMAAGLLIRVARESSEAKVLSIQKRDSWGGSQHSMPRRMS